MIHIVLESVCLCVKERCAGVARLRGQKINGACGEGVGGWSQTVKQHLTRTLTGCRSHPTKSLTHIFVTRNIWYLINLI